MERLKVAVVGCGVIARGHYLPEIRAMEQAELVAVCDVARDQAEYAAEAFGVPAVYTYYDQMLDEVDCDIIVDTAAIQAHFEINLKALQAGKHLYSQKPVTSTVEEATILIEEANKRGLKISASPVHMLRPGIRKVREMVAEGALGKIAFARVRSSHGGPEYFQAGRTISPAWFYQPGAGPLLDMGVHGLHTITGILGPARAVACMSGVCEPVRTVRGTGSEHDGEQFGVKVDDNTLVMLDFGGGTFGFLDCSYCVKASEGPGVEVMGSKGVVSMPHRGQNTIRFYNAIPSHGKERGWTELEASSEYVTQSVGVYDLIQAIKEGRKPILTPEHARHVIEIMNKCYIAAREGRTIPLETTF